MSRALGPRPALGPGATSAGRARSLAGADPRAIQPAEAGVALGRLARSGRRAGPAVYAGWRDTIVAFMAPGSGKTTAQAIPFVLSAPGAVIATSNKSDLWAPTPPPPPGPPAGRRSPRPPPPTPPPP